jgi:hypothetical protein
MAKRDSLRPKAASRPEKATYAEVLQRNDENRKGEGKKRRGDRPP